MRLDKNILKLLTENKKEEIIFLDKNPKLSDYSAAQMTPLELKINIDKRDKHIEKLEKILTNEKKLKKIISSKVEMDKLQSALNKLKKEEILPSLRKELRKNIPGQETLGVDFGISSTTLGDLLKIERLETIGQGVTTIVFNHPKIKNRVIAVTLDTKKLDWLEANKELFGYTYITKIDYDKGNEAHVFTMNKIHKFFDDRDFPAHKMNLIHSEVIVPYFYISSKKGEVEVKDIDWIIEHMDNKELIDILKKVQNVYKPNDILDLHGGQWGMDSKGKILLFDPVIDRRIFSKIHENNTKSWKTVIKHFFQELFESKDKKNERQKIIKLLTK